MTDKRKNKRLNSTQQHQLNMWMIDNKDMLLTQRPTRANTAVEAGDKLELEITESHIKTSQTATGVSWKSGAACAPNIADIEQRLRILAKWIRYDVNRMKSYVSPYDKAVLLAIETGQALPNDYDYYDDGEDEDEDEDDDEDEEVLG